MLAIQFSYMDLLLSKPTPTPFPPFSLYLNDILYSHLNHRQSIGICIDTKRDKVKIGMEIKGKQYEGKADVLGEVREESYEWLQLKEIQNRRKEKREEGYPKVLVRVRRMQGKNRGGRGDIRRTSMDVEPGLTEVDSQSIIRKIKDEVLQEEEYSFEGKTQPKTYRDREEQLLESFQDKYRSHHLQNLNQKRKLAIMRILKSFEQSAGSPSVLPATFDLY